MRGTSLLCRMGLHRWQRDRNSDGTFWCERCGKPGDPDAYPDLDRMPPGGGADGVSG